METDGTGSGVHDQPQGPAPSMITDSFDDHEDGGESTGSGSAVKNFKTTLCQFYLAGPCKNGDKCNYAHGTSELRTSAGTALSELSVQVKDKVIKGNLNQIKNSARGELYDQGRVKYKTSLCVKFVQNGFCPFGNECNFAHGIQEVKKAAENVQHLADINKKIEENANYKTSLCKRFMQGLVCPFADGCQYAHGRHELRERQPAVPARDLAPEVRATRLERAKQVAGYKTKPCLNYEKDGSCDYEELCHYAHGEDELREASEDEKDMLQRRNPFYKTSLCEKHKTGECPYGSSCIYAHDESELRSTSSYKTALCKTFLEKGSCPFGEDCRFAHGKQEQRRQMHPNNPLYKTSMCLTLKNGGSCPRGDSCHYAHSRLELRSQPGFHPGMGMAFSGPGGPNFGMLVRKGQQTVYRTTMCNVAMESNGYCPRGDLCHFAHSFAEMRAGQNADPKFKTELCDSWKSSGHCERGNNCKFAHGPGDLRSGHGFPPPDNFKTTMCREAVQGNCPRGSNCNFAHSSLELRAKFAPPMGAPGGYPGSGSSGSGRLGSNFGGSGGTSTIDEFYTRYGGASSIPYPAQQQQHMNRYVRVNCNQPCGGAYKSLSTQSYYPQPSHYRMH